LTLAHASTYELAKTGRIQFSHPEGVHDDRFWAIAMAVSAIRSHAPSRPIGKTEG
jgi:hypothetical protein